MPYQGPKRMIKEFNEKFFPPCILKIFNGVSDGRKRSVFILNNFLRNMGWDSEKIEKQLIQWNEKNKPPLPQNYVKTQFRWHNRQKRNFLPPNCDHQNFYVSMGVCLPDEICKAGTSRITIKNPVNYPFRKIKKR
jgi:DNA primase large subunit